MVLNHLRFCFSFSYSRHWRLFHVLPEIGGNLFPAAKGLRNEWMKAPIHPYAHPIWYWSRTIISSIFKAKGDTWLQRHDFTTRRLTTDNLSLAGWTFFYPSEMVLPRPCFAKQMTNSCPWLYHGLNTVKHLLGTWEAPRTFSQIAGWTCLSCVWFLRLDTRWENNAPRTSQWHYFRRALLASSSSYRIATKNSAGRNRNRWNAYPRGYESLVSSMLWDEVVL